jgi:uncharacterized delta-60 repeat protein
MKHILMLSSLVTLAVLAGCSSDPAPVVSDPTKDSSGSENLTIAARKPGSLDLTFGKLPFDLRGTGTVTTAIGSSNDKAKAVALQTNGKIVVAGSSATPSGEEFALVRYNINGAVDTTFGSGGKIVTSLAQHYNLGRALGIQSDGKIVLGGSIWTGYSTDFALLRYNTNGSVDTTFGSGGVVQNNWVPGPPPPGGFYYGYGGGVESLAFQPDGKIVVAGTYFVDPSVGSYEYFFAVVRYNANGSLDTSFGTGGITKTATYPGFRSHATSMVLQPNGKIVVAGYDTPQDDSTSDMAVVRYNTNGSLDTSFDGDGIARVGFLGYSFDYANAVKIQSNGKIVLAGYSNANGTNDFALARLNTNGSLDSKFDSDGILTTPIGLGSDAATSVEIQSDGGIVVGGKAEIASSFDFALVRYKSNGSLDTAFGSSGKVTTAFGGRYEGANALGIQSDDKIVLAGAGFNGTQDVFALARYNP